MLQTNAKWFRKNNDRNYITKIIIFCYIIIMENFTSISFCIFILLVSHDQRELNERYIVINMMLNMLIILEENFYINNIQKKQNTNISSNISSK